jgi:hypothetical protein
MACGSGWQRHQTRASGCFEGEGVSDRYVIVYRDGYVGADHDRLRSDRYVREDMGHFDPDFRPAYRIRGRYKRLDASRALYEVTGRRAPAGAEK